MFDCIKCDRPLPVGIERCPYCGYVYKKVANLEEEHQIDKKPNILLFIALGVLALVLVLAAKGREWPGDDSETQEISDTGASQTSTYLDSEWLAENGESDTILTSGIYIVGEDIINGKYDFNASKGTGNLKIYKSYEGYKDDEYGFDAFAEFDMLADGASVGLLNEDVYTDMVSNIRLSDGWCLVIDKGLEIQYQIGEATEGNVLSVGTYIVGEDIDVGKYDFTAIRGSGSVKIYNSYDEYLEDEYGFDAFSDYDMKEANASVGMLNEDVYSESISNIRLEEGQCLVIEKGLKLELKLK